MKICTKCNEERSFDFFYKSSKNPDGHHAWCKPCNNAYSQGRYSKGDKARKKRNQANFELKNRTFIWIYLTENPCIDCGNGDPRVLEFDHRDGVEKKFNISESISRHSLATIKEEINKCDVRCANCHRIRTIEQFGTWKGSFKTG